MATPLDYWDLVRPLALPSGAQVDAFVRYVADAENWLKTAPFAAGATVLPFLDPNAGARIDLQRETGTYAVQVLLAGAELLHGREMPTQAYRAAFGYLNYHTDLGAGTADVQGDVLRGARLPEPAVVYAGRLVPVPVSIRTHACRPGALLHGTFRAAEDAGALRRFRFAVERLPRLESAPSGHPLLAAIAAWSQRCHMESENAFTAWLGAEHGELAGDLGPEARWRRYVEWRDSDACASLHRDQDARFAASGIPERVVALHAAAVEALGDATRAMLRDVAAGRAATRPGP